MMAEAALAPTAWMPGTFLAGFTGVADPAAKLDSLLAARRAPNEYAHRAMHRRSEIFAATRRLIADRGLPKVTIRLIAQESGTSAQTLYNLIGDRETIMVQALKEHICAMWTFAGRCGDYPNALVAMADAHCASGVTRPRYTLNSLAGQSPTRIFHEEIETYLIDLHAGLLKALEREGMLRGSVDVVALSRRIILYSVGALIDWGGRGAPSSVLREELVTGVSCLLLHSLESEAAGMLEAWLDSQVAQAKGLRPS